MTRIIRGPIYTAFLNQKLREIVDELCELAGVRPQPIPSDSNSLADLDPSRNALLLTELDAPLSSDAPPGWSRVLCRSASAIDRQTSGLGELVLPADAGELIGLLRDWNTGETSSGSAVLVGSWHGGGGVTACSFALAESLSGVVLDASAKVSFPLSKNSGSLTWEDLDSSDMPPGSAIVSALPRIGVVPVLTSGSPASLRPSSELVIAVASRSPRMTVVDCGDDVRNLARLWDDFVDAGLSVRPLLVGRAKETHIEAAVRAFTALSADSLTIPLDVLTIGRASSVFTLVEERFRLRSRRAPKTSALRGWRRIAKDI